MSSSTFRYSAASYRDEGAMSWMVCLLILLLHHADPITDLIFHSGRSVAAYDSKTATLSLLDQYPVPASQGHKNQRVITIDASLLLGGHAESLAGALNPELKDITEIGTWINVIGNVEKQSRFASRQISRHRYETRRKLNGVKATLIWDTGAISSTHEYKKAVNARGKAMADMASARGVDHGRAQEGT